MSDFDTVVRVNAEVRDDPKKPVFARQIKAFDEVDCEIALYEADHEIDTYMEQYRARFDDPKTFEDLVAVYRIRYREGIKVVIAAARELMENPNTTWGSDGYHGGMMATSKRILKARKARVAREAEVEKQKCRLFNDHDAALIDDIRCELDALLMVPLTPRDIKLTFEKAVAKVVVARSLPIRSGFGANAKLVCPGCNHDPHKANDCNERVLDAAGDVDWCPCGIYFMRKGAK